MPSAASSSRHPPQRPARSASGSEYPFQRIPFRPYGRSLSSFGSDALLFSFCLLPHHKTVQLHTSTAYHTAFRPHCRSFRNPEVQISHSRISSPSQQAPHTDAAPLFFRAHRQSGSSDRLLYNRMHSIKVADPSLPVPASRQAVRSPDLPSFPADPYPSYSPYISACQDKISPVCGYPHTAHTVPTP